MTRGFVTIATGNIKYYKMAYNLLLSYRLHNADSEIPFAILCDQVNEYSIEFDKIILLENPYKSFLDKLDLLNNAPFQKNIFIDSDCLIYRNLNDFWNDFPDEGVSCFGNIVSLDSNEGWFKKGDIGDNEQQVNYSINLHSGFIFFNKDALTKKVYEKSLEIYNNYSSYRFRIFNKPADEPILSLAMAILKIKPIELQNLQFNNKYLFYPCAKRFRSNVVAGYLKYTVNGKDWIENVGVLHWQNINTEKPKYLLEEKRLESKSKKEYLYYSKLVVLDIINKIINIYIPWIRYEIKTKIIKNEK